MLKIPAFEIAADRIADPSITADCMATSWIVDP